MSVDSDNIMRLHENSKVLNNKVMELTDTVRKMEASIAILQSELARNKQLVIHLMSKGSGPTTR